jgi:hypothetical protein
MTETVIDAFVAGALAELDKLIQDERDPSVRRLLERVRPAIEQRTRQRIREVMARIDDDQHEDTLH